MLCSTLASRAVSVTDGTLWGLPGLFWRDTTALERNDFLLFYNIFFDISDTYLNVSLKLYSTSVFRSLLNFYLVIIALYFLVINCILSPNRFVVYVMYTIIVTCIRPLSIFYYVTT